MTLSRNHAGELPSCFINDVMILCNCLQHFFSHWRVSKRYCIMSWSCRYLWSTSTASNYFFNIIFLRIQIYILHAENLVGTYDKQGLTVRPYNIKLAFDTMHQKFSHHENVFITWWHIFGEIFFWGIRMISLLACSADRSSSGCWSVVNSSDL